jgi:hypothetical protein
MIALSKLIGRSGLRTLLSTCGIEADDKILDRMLERVKAEDFLELAEPPDILRYLEQIRRGLARPRIRSMKERHPEDEEIPVQHEGRSER